MLSEGHAFVKIVNDIDVAFDHTIDQEMGAGRLFFCSDRTSGLCCHHFDLPFEQAEIKFR
jgi:hypothetical protein